MSRRAVVAVVIALVCGSSAASASGAAAPGAPGAPAVWTRADKQGFGTAAGTSSPVWYTLGPGQLTEVYYPDLGTPAERSLELVVTDGRTFTDRERTDTRHAVQLADPRSLTYRQVDTARSGRYRITKTYVTDPARAAVLIDVHFQSLTGRPYRVYVLHDPALSNDGSDDRGRSDGAALLTSDSRAGSALRAAPAFTATSSGFAGRSDGWRDLRSDHRLDHRYDRTGKGNVVQTGRTALTGLAGHQDLTLALGFARTAGAASAVARAALAGGFASAASAYANGWHAYLDSLAPAPASAAAGASRTLYDVSLMVLAASEDKRHRGAFVAAPAMPWAWGRLTIDKPSDAYHLVWSRDLYEIATALLAAGDRAAAERALGFLWLRQQKSDGSFPQNSDVTGKPHWTNLQLDEVADPIVLTWQLGRADAATYAHVRRAADFIARKGPRSPQERWENQSGYSPATIASEIAGLICAADLARRNGDSASAARWEALADRWQQSVEHWTVTTNGPLASHPYYLRLSKHGTPDSGTTYKLGDSGPKAIDERVVVDPSFLELVRLGVKRADDPVVAESLDVVDSVLKVDTPNGPFWHRYTLDGYGETRTGAGWDLSPDGSFRTIGRAWPIFSGERGEYELANGRAAGEELATMARSANAGWLLPEQVWDHSPPFQGRGFPAGEGTFSATPLAWSHAQFVRLALSIDAGRPVERPAVVACRYAGVCG